MKNTCDICGKDSTVLLHAIVYDDNFAKKTVTKEIRVCKIDLAKL